MGDEMIDYSNGSSRNPPHDALLSRLMSPEESKQRQNSCQKSHIKGGMNAHGPGRAFVPTADWMLELKARDKVSLRTILTLAISQVGAEEPLPVAADYKEKTARWWFGRKTTKPLPAKVACRLQRLVDGNAPCPLWAVAGMAKCEVQSLFLEARRQASRAERSLPHFARKRYPDFDWDSFEDTDEWAVLYHDLLPEILATYRWSMWRCIAEGYTVLRGRDTWRHEDAPARKMRVELSRCYGSSPEEFDALMIEVFERQLYLDLPRIHGDVL
jgi:hypothetical protein